MLFNKGIVRSDLHFKIKFLVAAWRISLRDKNKAGRLALEVVVVPAVREGSQSSAQVSSEELRGYGHEGRGQSKRILLLELGFLPPFLCALCGSVFPFFLGRSIASLLAFFKTKLHVLGCSENLSG